MARTVLDPELEGSLDEHYFWPAPGALRRISLGGRTSDAQLEIVSGDLQADIFVAPWTEHDRTAGLRGGKQREGCPAGRLEFRKGLAPSSSGH